MPQNSPRFLFAAERVKRVIEAEHFRVDRVIGHYLDMLPNTNYCEEINKLETV